MWIKRLLAPFLATPVQHAVKLIRDRNYRRLVQMDCRLGGLPRYAECSVSLGEWKLTVPDAASFLSAYRQIFVERGYLFAPRTAAPRIVDLGANIGLSALFFKSLFPAASIAAFEADPVIFGYLKENLHGNGFHDVELYNNAAWFEDTQLQFSSEGADGGRVAQATDANLVTVQALDIAGVFAGQRIDLLKMDIEGAEVEVLSRCRNLLASVDRLFVEFHSSVNRDQRLDELLEILRSYGFRYQIHSAYTSPHPFVERCTLLDYDMLLNIYACKEPVNGS